MQKDFVDESTQTGPQVVFRSLNGDRSRPTRVLITVVGPGTLWLDTHSPVTDATGFPIREGLYFSEELTAGEALYAVAGSGETVDVRISVQGAAGTSSDS